MEPHTGPVSEARVSKPIMQLRNHLTRRRRSACRDCAAGRIAPERLMRWSALWPGSIPVFGLSVAVLLAGCDLSYYAHLARGQAALILRSRTVARALQDSSLDPVQRERLRLVQQVRDYATASLGLADTPNYTLFYETGGRPACWNVSACLPHRFQPYTWRFPIVGTVPYKGFFALERAEKEKMRLTRMGYDVYLRPVSAYSTLGYLPDPVFSTMLEFPADVLTELILHELTHATVYVSGHTDFNESLATFVGRRGSIEFLASRAGADSTAVTRAHQRRRDAARFQEFISQVVVSLDSLYESGADRESILAQRDTVYAYWKQRYRDIRNQFELLDYGGFLDRPVNNARLLSHQRYHTHLGLFDSLLCAHSASLPTVIELSRRCADAASGPWDCLRSLPVLAQPLPDRD